jgi:hypothetical protein
MTGRPPDIMHKHTHNTIPSSQVEDTKTRPESRMIKSLVQVSLAVNLARHMSKSASRQGPEPGYLPPLTLPSTHLVRSGESSPSARPSAHPTARRSCRRNSTSSRRFSTGGRISGQCPVVPYVGPYGARAGGGHNVLPSPVIPILSSLRSMLGSLDRLVVLSCRDAENQTNHNNNARSFLQTANCKTKPSKSQMLNRCVSTV